MEKRQVEKETREYRSKRDLIYLLGEQRYTVASKEGSIYHLKLWLRTENDEYAKELFVKYYNDLISKAQETISKAQESINHLNKYPVKC